MPQSSRSTQLAQAALNNAIWCDTICCAHGNPGEFSADWWINRQPTPRFYPNAVTLTSAAYKADELAQLLPPMGAVKDSFCVLDLASVGYQPRFEASWLWHDPAQPKPPNVAAELRWSSVQTVEELAAWESAWNGPDTSSEPRVFLPSLLDNAEITFIAAYRAGQIVAGAIANRTGDVVGVSNLFYPAQAAHACWTGCIVTIMALYPTLPLVGYERDDDLPIAQAVGFAAIGPLRIWARP